MSLRPVHVPRRRNTQHATRGSSPQTTCSAGTGAAASSAHARLIPGVPAGLCALAGGSLTTVNGPDRAGLYIPDGNRLPAGAVKASSAG